MADLIERQAAIDAVKEYGAFMMEYTEDMSKEEIAENAIRSAKNTMIWILKELPYAEPERKPGRWEIRETADEDVEAKCPCCGFETLVNQPGNGLHMVNDLHFCPNCGEPLEVR